MAADNMHFAGYLQMAHYHKSFNQIAVSLR